MRKKRFQHHATNLAAIFCGWQIAWDWGVLTRLGSGVLTIDVLTGDCRQGELGIEPLEIAGVLGDWLRGDLEAAGIPVEAVDDVRLVVEFVNSESDTQRDLGTAFADPRPPFVHCDLVLHGSLVSGQDRYESTTKDYLEWPKCMAR